MLLPVLSKARQSAQRSSCAGNLKQIAIAFFLYIDDHAGYFPGRDTYRSDFNNFFGGRYGDAGVLYRNYPRPLNPYLDIPLVNTYLYKGAKVFHCPADNAYRFTNGTQTRYDYVGNSYTYNATGNKSIADGTFSQGLCGKIINQVRNPGICIEVGDWTLMEFYGKDNGVPNLYRYHDQSRPMCNTVFVDGHLQYIMMSPTPTYQTGPNYTFIYNGSI
jgi:hypothetical protein